MTAIVAAWVAVICMAIMVWGLGAAATHSRIRIEPPSPWHWDATTWWIVVFFLWPVMLPCLCGRDWLEDRRHHREAKAWHERIPAARVIQGGKHDGR